MLSEMGNTAEALGVGRRFRGHTVQPYVMSLVARESVLLSKKGRLWVLSLSLRSCFH